MRNWKTTLAGAVGTLGTALIAHSAEKWEWWVGSFLVAVSPLLLGLVAKDHDVVGVPGKIEGDAARNARGEV